MPEKLTYNKYNEYDNNTKQLYSYLKSSTDLSPIAIAGILGNFIHETTGGSGINPNAQNSKDGGYGFAQWTFSRRDNLINFAKQHNMDYRDLRTQTKFFIHELNSPQFKKAKQSLENAKTIEEATKNFYLNFESMGRTDDSLEKRIKYAKSIEPYNYTEENISNENIPWKWALKSNNTSVENLNNNIKRYLNTLEQEYQNLILATAGSDGSHATNSRHYNNNAVDLRFNEKLYNRIKNDPNRLKYGLVLINPNHGNAPHIHLSYGNGSENKMDVWVDPFSEEAKKITNNNIFYNNEYNNEYNDNETHTPMASGLDSNAYQEYVTMIKDELKKKDEEEKAKQEAEQVRNNLIKKQQERDYLLAQTLSAKLPFIERNY